MVQNDNSHWRTRSFEIQKNKNFHLHTFGTFFLDPHPLPKLLRSWFLHLFSFSSKGWWDHDFFQELFYFPHARKLSASEFQLLPCIFLFSHLLLLKPSPFLFHYLCSHFSSIIILSHQISTARITLGNCEKSQAFPEHWNLHRRKYYGSSVVLHWLECEFSG